MDRHQCIERTIFLLQVNSKHIVNIWIVKMMSENGKTLVHAKTNTLNAVNNTVDIKSKLRVVSYN